MNTKMKEIVINKNNFPRNTNGTFASGIKRGPMSEETKRKIGLAQLGEKNHAWGKQLTGEHKLKMSTSLRGIKHGPMSEETKQKVSIAKKGTPSWNKGRTLSKKHRENLSLSHIGQKSYFKGKKRPEITGEKHPMWGKKRPEISGSKNNNWKGGITILYRSIRSDVRSRIWRDEIFKRDRYTCQGCGKVGGKIQVDHIKEFSVIIKENNITTLNEAKLCKELWDINNGQTLCKEQCHKNKTTKFMKLNWSNQFSNMEKIS